MKLALYSGFVSIAYVALALLAPAAAEAMIVPFIAALLLPQCWVHIRSRPDRHA